MALELNEYGKNYQRFPEVRDEIFDYAHTKIDSELDKTPDSLINNLLSALADAERKVQEFSQAVWDSNDIGSAEDVMLDNLAILTGNVRLIPRSTEGDVLFTAVEGFQVTLDMVIESVNGDRYEPVRVQNVNAQSVFDATIQVGAYHPNTEYGLSIAGVSFIFLASNNPDPEIILNGLATQINNYGATVATVTVDEETEVPTLHIKQVNRDNPVTVIMIPYLVFSSITSPVVVRNVETGDYPAGLGTISVIPEDFPDTSGRLYYVYNEKALITGDFSETDTAFRSRILSSYIRTGHGTFDYLYNDLVALDDVKSAYILENRTREMDINSPDENLRIPPNSFQVVIDGGDYGEIAEVIWRNKPAGIQCYSDSAELHNTSVWEIIHDYNYQEHTVQFRIPDNLNVHFVINYVLYNEEVFPVDGENNIAESVADYINTLEIGKDIIPSRTYGSIFEVVDGVQSVHVWVAVTEDYSYNPTWPGEYVDITTPVSEIQLPTCRPEWIEFNR